MSKKEIRLVPVKGKVLFCDYCGKLLNKKWNKAWDSKDKEFCNIKCRKLDRTKSIPKRSFSR